MRDRLIDILTKTFDEQYEKRRLITPQHTADYLLENGVIVPPCKVGKTIYRAYGFSVMEYTVVEIKFDSFIMWFRGYNDEYVEEHKKFLFDETTIGKTVFLSREEAERALKGGEG